MSLVSFAQVFIVSLLGAMSPGPSMILIISNAIFKGRHNGILTAIGHGVGIAFYATFAVLGIGLILKTDMLIFNSLKILSIIFLLFIGINSILSKKKFNLKNNNRRENTISFMQGFSISILNPKILIWFIAIFSQFMSTNNDIIFNTFLISIAGVVDACWYVILTLAVTTASALNYLQTKIHLIRKIQGILFIILGSGLLIKLFM